MSESLEGGADAPRHSGPFSAGDRAQLTGPRGRLHTVTLLPGGEFHTHRGVVKHDSIIGQPDGTVVSATNGDLYLALRPLLSDFVMSMPEELLTRDRNPADYRG